MYRTQVYDGFNAETILAKVAKKHNKPMMIWLYRKCHLIACVIGEPYEYVDGFKNVSFVGKVTIERCPSGFRVYNI